LPSGLPIVAGAPLRARCRPALTLRAHGLADFFQRRSPAESGEEVRARTFALSRRLPADISSARRQRKRAAHAPDQR
jgi:hypothetical protein